MKIRPALRAELNEVHAIVRAATFHMEEQGIFQWDEVYPNRDVLRDDIEKRELHVLEVNRGLVAFAVINEEQSPDWAKADWQYAGQPLTVHRLTVDPAFQRRGFAMRLMDFVEGTAAKGGYDCIRLDAFTQNPAAFGLYEKRGYRKAGIVPFRKGEFFCYERKIHSLPGS